MSRPSSSVMAIVLDYHGLHYTEACLEAIAKSSFPIDVALINNAPFDKNLHDLAQNHSFCTLIEMGYNAGFTVANNIGITIAMKLGYEYILLLNNDALIDVDTIATLIGTFRSQPEYGMLSPVIYEWGSPDKIWFCKGDIDWRNVRTYRRLDCPEILSDKAIWDSSFLSGCALLVRSNVIQQIGCLDEKIFWYREDSDWSVRCQKAGYKCGVVKAGFVQHKGYASSGGAESEVALFYAARNQVKFYKKHGVKILIPRFFILYLRDHLLFCKKLYKSGRLDLVEAVINGVFAGLHGYSGDRGDRKPIPNWLMSFLVKLMFFGEGT